MLDALGQQRLSAGDWLAVFGDIEPQEAETADAAIDRLVTEVIAAVGSEGHLVVPTFTLGAEFDRARTPAATGRFAERFRLWPGVVRSAHPVYSAAVFGPNALDVVRDHDLYLPFRPETPLGQAVAHDGKILLLGSDQRCNPMIHVARLSVEREWPTIWINVDIVLEFGGRRRKRHVLAPCDVAYSSLGAELEACGIARSLQTEWGRMTWMSARELSDYVATVERKNPERFLCNRPDCSWCTTARMAGL
ncbi:AAC(3) family N-acetyltransferase [Candidatus Sumerlaeota bacterium]|nr:AAC(3) family N-acetyltransferase [Candidatus Sumerlaeota bacterium]